jgi:hypothetical protein
MFRTLTWTSTAALATCLLFSTACSSDSGGGSGGSTATGGTTSTGGTTATGGTTSTGGSAGSTSTGGSGGSGASCPTGLFDGTSCTGFLDGCWAPDTSGTCSDTGTQLTWTDGHKIERIGASAGLYGPGGNTPCISLAFDGTTNTASLTKVSSGDVLKNKDNGDGTITITCPGGDEHTYDAAALEQDNVCKGLACPK